MCLRIGLGWAGSQLIGTGLLLDSTPDQQPDSPQQQVGHADHHVDAVVIGPLLAEWVSILGLLRTGGGLYGVLSGWTGICSPR